MTDPTSPEALEAWRAITPALDALTEAKALEIKEQREGMNTLKRTVAEAKRMMQEGK